MKQLVSLLFHDVYEQSPAESGFPGAGADRYKQPLSLFKEHIAAVAKLRLDKPVIVTKMANEASGQVPFSITVDDGGLSYHSLLADCLEEQGWLGHCFVTTACIGQDGFLTKQHIRELHTRGHLIGSHSVSHPARFSTLPFDKMVEEWAKSKAELEDIVGEQIDVGSVPGGYFSSTVARAARQAGLTILFTSEPEVKLRNQENCLLLGRFALRNTSPAALSANFVTQKRTTLLREWTSWNAKKLLKNTLGSGYTKLTGMVSRNPG